MSPSALATGREPTMQVHTTFGGQALVDKDKLQATMLRYFLRRQVE
jgi:hypothetical protein